MKKQIFLLSTTLASLGLMAFGFLTLDKPHTAEVRVSHCQAPKLVAADPIEKTYSNFFYRFGSGYLPITKSELSNMTEASDFLSEERISRITEYESVSVILVIDNVQSEIREIGKTNAFNDAQLKLLHDSEVSTRFVVKAQYEEINEESGKLHYGTSTPHMTVVPEKQAEYLLGKKALIAFFRDHNKENTANLDEDKLQPAKLHFTVSKNGSITKVYLDRTSGFEDIDKNMVDLVNRLPSYWIPAENAKGEKVDQELVVSFGMVGC